MVSTFTPLRLASAPIANSGVRSDLDFVMKPALSPQLQESGVLQIVAPREASVASVSANERPGAGATQAARYCNCRVTVRQRDQRASARAQLNQTGYNARTHTTSRRHGDGRAHRYCLDACTGGDAGVRPGRHVYGQYDPRQ